MPSYKPFRSKRLIEKATTIRSCINHAIRGPSLFSTVECYTFPVARSSLWDKKRVMVAIYTKITHRY